MQLIKIKRVCLKIVCFIFNHCDVWVTSYGDDGIIKSACTVMPKNVVIYQCLRCGRLEAVHKTDEEIKDMRSSQGGITLSIS